MQTLEERLEKVEKQNRKLVRLLIGLFSIFPILGILAFQQSSQFFKVIETNKLILKDKNGRERAILMIDENGNSPKLRFKNERDSIVTSIGVNGEYGYLNISHVVDRNNIYVTDKGIIISENEKSKQNLISSTGTTIKQDDVVRIQLSNNEGNDIRGLWIYDQSESKGNATMIEGFNTISQLRSFIGNSKNNSYAHIFDENGNLRSVIGATQTKDSRGRTINNPESSILLFDENGNSVFQAPN